MRRTAGPPGQAAPRPPTPEPAGHANHRHPSRQAPQREDTPIPPPNFLPLGYRPLNVTSIRLLHRAQAPHLPGIS
jgi:hypothetical protein